MYADARAHKRTEQQSRRAARRVMDKLRAFCVNYGIAFEGVISTTTETEEEKEGHGRAEGIAAGH